MAIIGDEVTTENQDANEDNSTISETGHGSEMDLTPAIVGDIDINTSLSDLDKLAKSDQLRLFTERNVKHPTTNLDTLMHILKGNIGTGILALPNSLVNSGLAFGIVGLLLIALVCIHCMHIVLKCARTLCLRTGTPSLDFASTAQSAFATGPVKLRRFANAARFITSLFLCITQLGFCCVYFTFISSNIQEIVQDTAAKDWDVRIYATIILLPIVLTCLIPNLKFLVPASIIANILQVVSLAIIFYYIFQDLPPASSRKQFSTWSQLPLWFGTSIYAFEGIGLVLPLENNMKRPQDFGGLTGVLQTGMSFVTIIFTAVAFYGYLKYGDEAAGSLTLNLPKTTLAEFVRAAYAMATLLSYCLQFYVPIGVMWPTVKNRLSQRYHFIGQMVFRIAFVLLTYALAILIPQLSLFISLVGAFGGSYLSIIIPPIIEMVTYWSEGMSRLTISKDIVLIIVGLIGFVTGTYTSIYQIVSTFGS